MRVAQGKAMKQTRPMPKPQPRRRGRPKVTEDSGASVTLRVDQAKLELADELVESLGEMVPGLKPSRGDVLRAALTRGLDAMREDMRAKR
jgi:hypothetical protein